MLQEITDQKQWNKFLFSQPSQAGIFLQSWEWGEFQKKVGRRVYRFESGGALAQVIELPLPLGKKYWFIPRGPIIDEKIENSKQKIENLIEYIAAVGKTKGAIFLKIEPTSRFYFLFSRFLQVHSVQPKQTLVLDLSKSTDELLQGMHEKTRYNIRLAARKGVVHSSQFTVHSFEEFWKLLKETAKRDKFRTHPRQYYEKMLEVLGDSPGVKKPVLSEGKEVSDKTSDLAHTPYRHLNLNPEMHVRLHIAYHNTTPLAAAIVGYFGDTATYLHGASSYEHRALMAPYALHWQIMQQAKKDGFKFYDFWGIQFPSPLGRGQGEGVRGSWEGITRFKMGFGGQVVDYPGTFDLPVSRFWYKIYRLGRKILT